jgi:hypothetical protein
MTAATGLPAQRATLTFEAELVVDAPVHLTASSPGRLHDRLIIVEVAGGNLVHYNGSSEVSVRGISVGNSRNADTDGEIRDCAYK